MHADESGSDSEGAESTSSSYSSLSDLIAEMTNSEIDGETPCKHYLACIIRLNKFLDITAIFYIIVLSSFTISDNLLKFIESLLVLPIKYVFYSCQQTLRNEWEVPGSSLNCFILVSMRSKLVRV